MRYRRLAIKGGSYFFTLITFDRRPIFSDGQAVALFSRAQSLIRSRHPYETEAEVILPDHIHVIWQLPEGDSDFAGRWSLIKSTFTRWYLRGVDAKYQDNFEFPLGPSSSTLRAPSASRSDKREQAIWQRRYWEHLIHNEEDFAAHLDYIHFNPVKHGLARSPAEWPYSTFHDWVSRGVYEPEWGSTQPPKLPDWAGRE